MYGIDSVMTRWLQLALVSISCCAYLIYEALLMFVRCSLEYHLVLVLAMYLACHVCNGCKTCAICWDG